MTFLARSNVKWVGVILALLCIFLAYRWWMRVEPINSDDLVLFERGVEATEGRHWLQADENPERLRHADLRLGILPFLVPAISVFGATYAAYIAVSLALAALGFLLVWWIISKEIDPSLAVIIAGFHLVLPFELRDGGLLLVDLPCAVFSVLCLVLVEHLGVARKRPVTGGVLGGLAVIEAYLLRANSVALVLPALVILGFHRRRRIPTATAVAVLLLGISLEQMLLVRYGLGFGYRWSAIREALDAFGPRLPKYTVSEFWFRELTFLWKDFGGGWAGTFATSCYLAFLGALVLMLLKAGSPLLRALAFWGLASYAAFAYGFSDWDDGLVHALAPPLYRYFQPFYYGGVIAVAWSLGFVRGHLTKWSRVRSPDTIVAGVGIVLAIVALGVSTTWVGRRLANPCGELQQALCAIDQIATRSDHPPEILTTPRSARLIGLFRGSWSEPKVRWRLMSWAQPGRQLEKVDAVFFDWRRLSKDRLHLSKEEKKGYDEKLDGLLWELSDHFVIGQETSNYRLFQRSASVGVFRPIPNGRFESVDGATETLRAWTLTAPLDLEASDDGGVVLGLPPTARRVYLVSGKPSGLRQPPKQAWRYPLEPDSNTGLGVRVRLDFPEQVTASLFVIQFDNVEWLATDQAPLTSGTNYVRTTVAKGATAYRIGIRLAVVEGTASPVHVTIREVSLRPGEPGGDLCPCPE